MAAALDARAMQVLELALARHQLELVTPAYTALDHVPEGGRNGTVSDRFGGIGASMGDSRNPASGR